MRRARAATPAGIRRRRLDRDELGEKCRHRAWRSRHQERSPSCAAASAAFRAIRRKPRRAASFSRPRRGSRAPALRSARGQDFSRSRPASSAHATRPFCRARAAPSCERLRAPRRRRPAPRAEPPRREGLRGARRRSGSLRRAGALSRAPSRPRARRPAATKPRAEHGESRGLVVRQLLLPELVGRAAGSGLHLRELSLGERHAREIEPALLGRALLAELVADLPGLVEEVRASARRSRRARPCPDPSGRRRPRAGRRLRGRSGGPLRAWPSRRRGRRSRSSTPARPTSG